MYKAMDLLSFFSSGSKLISQQRGQESGVSVFKFAQDNADKL